jgi:Mg-chelatase subunit ChlD
MKKDYTHILIVLDASGSMSSIQDDIKGSFNEFLKKQREAKGKTVFDLYQFNDTAKRIVKAADLSQFHDDLMAKYDCSGCTALNDAVCSAIDAVGHEFAAMPEPERPEHVLCVIITDGKENASKEFSTKDVRDRIRHQQEVYSWNFQFLAANQDAFEAGESIGLDHDDCMDFFADKLGVESMCCALYDRMDDIRHGKKKRK